MAPDPQPSPNPRGDTAHWWRTIAVAVVFYAGAWLGHLLVVPGTNVGIFWPPAGAALGLLLLWGPRHWPGVAIGAIASFLPGLLASQGLVVGSLVAAGEVVADVVPPLLAVAWIRRFADPDPLHRVRDVLALALWGGLVAQGVAALMGGAVLWAGGVVSGPGLLDALLNWWVSNVASVLSLTPLVLAWRRPWPLQRPLLHAAMAAVTTLAGVTVFLWSGWGYAYFEYLTVLLVLWAGFTLGRRGATAAAVTLSAILIAATAAGRGHITEASLEQQLFLVSFYAMALSLTGVIVTAVVDERVHATADLELSEARLRSIVQASPIAIGWTDEAGRVEFWNRRAEEIFGYTLRDIPTVGRFFEQAYPDPAYREAARRRWLEALAAAPSNNGVARLDGLKVTCADGAVRDADLFGTTLGDRVLVMFVDQTERRQAEAQREELRGQLARAQRMESIGRLAGGVAHDLNNLLAPILGYAEVMTAELPAESRLKEDAGIIKAAAERARDLTRQLLAFGRRQVLAVRVLDLRQVVNELAPLLRRTLRENVRLEIDLPPHLWAVQADPAQLEQVVMNLAVNAQHAMPDGGQLIVGLSDVEVRPGRHDRPPGVQVGDWVCLSVRDTGAGMAPETVERIFEPFFTTRAEGEGTGLGLSIVHGVVAQHGGQIAVESAPGAGATFRVYLPRAAGAPELRPLPGVTLAGPARHQPSAAGRLVLLCEDSEPVRRVTQRMLERCGCRVLSAPDPARALALAAAEPGRIDLLVTDVVMPGQNGRQLHAQLCARRPGLPVLYMSGYAGDVIGHLGVLGEGAVFLQKPFNAEALDGALRSLLEGHAPPPKGLG